MDLSKKFAVWICCMALVACAAPATKVPQMALSQQQLIASDLVGVLVQIEQLPTSSTTLNLPAENFGKDDFSAALQNRLEDAGFGIRTMGGNQAQQLVDYSVDSSVNEAGRAVSTYTVTVGRFGVRRSYEQVDAVQLRPLGSMEVKGVDAAGLRIDDALFAGSDKVSAPVITPGESVREVNTGTESMTVSVPVSPYSNPIRNYRELGKSNFADWLSSYRIVDEGILLFGNDSVRLGQVNKMRVSQFVSKFDAESDVFSVIGCSNGSTTVKGGPQVLALGRGERVRQELLYAGVPDENILHEGCWSNEYYDEKMPRRAVVISLQRLID